MMSKAISDGSPAGAGELTRLIPLGTRWAFWFLDRPEVGHDVSLPVGSLFRSINVIGPYCINYYKFEN